MFQIKSYKNYILILLVAHGASIICGDDKGQSDSTNEECCNIDYSKLKLHELCTDKLSAKCANLDQVSASTACLAKVCSDLVCTKDINVSGRFAAGEIATQKLCAGTVVSDNVYANSNIYSNNYFTNFKATMVFSSNSTYNLGSPINFNVVLDDPNNNVTLSPTTYTAPRSGYYIATLQVDQTNLLTAAQTLGTPIANMQILVNGVVFRQAYTPYLSFFNSQNSTLTALLHLKAGDKVTSIYDIITLDQASGAQPLVGTVVITGNGTEGNESIFKIHYLSTDGTYPTPPTCTPTPVDCSNCQCKPCCTPSTAC